MVRKIIQIDEEKCNGCGLCARACHESAIGMVDGKAKLLKDDYCDGLGDCLPVCPTKAITFVEREAEAYDEAAVLANKKHGARSESTVLPCGCPSNKSMQMNREGIEGEVGDAAASQLRQWPVQIKLAPLKAPYYSKARLLIAADCTAYAYGNFHQDFIRNTIALIGCPKLDDEDYSKKLTEIIRQNDIKSVTVVRMEVPCCGKMEQAVNIALQNSGKCIPWQVVTISTDGRIVE